MKINVGKADRVIRVVVGLVLLSLPFWVDGSWRWLGLIGLIPLLTGLMGSCLLYSMLGLNTCPMRKD